MPTQYSFLRFALDLDKMPGSLWLLLGRCLALADQVGSAALKPALAKDLYSISLSRFIQGTVAIEGTELSDEMIEAAVNRSDGTQPPEYAPHEIDAYVRAAENILRSIRLGERLELTSEYLCGLNRLVLRGSQVEPGINIGALRHHPVRVHGYTPPGEAALPGLVDRLCKWLDDDLGASESQQNALGRQGLSLLAAVVGHLYVEMIHPFGDGNGRVGRLLELDILAHGRVPFVCALALTNHYNLRKNEYFQSIRDAEEDVTDAGVFAFVEFSVKGLYDSIQELMLRIQSQNIQLAWQDLIFEQFRSVDHRAAPRRRRQLALSLKPEPVQVSAVRNLSPELARLYAQRADSSVVDDLKKLEQMNLARREEKGWVANVEYVLGFQPD